MNKTRCTAHSGSDGTLDNSMQFVYYALGTDADALEVDIRREPDTGELVLGHDMAGENPITLREVFEQVIKHPHMKINCDLKEPNMERQVIELAEKIGIKKRIILSGTVNVSNISDAEFIAEQVYWNLEEQVKICAEDCINNPKSRVDAMKNMCDICHKSGVTVINVNEKLIDDEVLDVARRNDMKLSVWTVNSVSKMMWFRDKGVYNITTRRISQALNLPNSSNGEAVCLFDREYLWSNKDTSSDIPFSFECTSEITELVISFTYSPGEESEKSICLPEVQAAVERYYGGYPHEIEPMTAEQYLPVKNLITLSLAKDGVYLGNAHRWSPEQEHIISCRYASSGFIAPKAMAGEWTGMLHLHEIISPECKGHIRIEGKII